MNILKNIGAVLAGLIFIGVTHSATDATLEATGVFPPPSAGLHVTWMMALALAYRVIFSIIGCYITARLAPSRPIRHSLILGCIGLVLSTIGLIVSIQMNLSHVWYPVALILVTMPCAWLGGKLAERNRK